ncbi:MAG: efflux RND transporter periplasmic adaptor subunit [Candidatus Hydrogenedentes bacterium]|nr:efflux RND transporter periplasmic adaptor subunit [Candidatus Hydrogenedentota bacterium]
MKSWVLKIIGALSPLLVLAGGAAAVAVLFASAPQVKRTSEVKPAPLVAVVQAVRGSFPRLVQAYGSVMPAREVEIHPEVSGRVIEVHPSLEPGGVIPEGETLLIIDPEEYELALAQAQGALAEAEAALDVEKGRQLVAKREWDLFGKDMQNAELGESLALREPQLRQAEARIASAQSFVKQAELNLKRTRITAPFDVLVLSEQVDVGQIVSPGSSVASLAGADRFWIQVSVPIDRLSAVLGAAAQGRDTAHIFSDVESSGDAGFPGRVVRHLGQVDPESRMAQVLLEVEDPLGLDPREVAREPLALNTYVRADLDAGTLEDTISIPRRGLRENGEVWVADAENRLQVRSAEILWRQGEVLAIADGIRPGDRVVISPLDDLIPGMEVRVTEGDIAPNLPTLLEMEI